MAKTLSQRILPGIPVVESMLFGQSLDEMGLSATERGGVDISTHEPAANLYLGRPIEAARRRSSGAETMGAPPAAPTARPTDFDPAEDRRYK